MPPGHPLKMQTVIPQLFGPKAPDGLESNWVSTQGKVPAPVMRFYGAQDAFWDKTFKLPDVELVK